MTYRKKLIEVALPLVAINAASAREKSIRHGHPSTLHLWWARRPLAACRAVLFASLVDDPSEHPEEFPTEQAQEKERERLFRLIEELVKWENSNNENVLRQARAEILKSTGGNPPPVFDPFAGGGSIPLEAQRLGLEAHASDLNPVAVLINKALIEIPPKFAGRPPVNPEARQSLMGADWSGARGLANDIRYYGKWMRNEAERRIGYLYPKVILPKEYGGSEATAIAWLWTRTVTCPNPACGAKMPLVRSFYLSKKKGKEAWVEPHVDHTVTPPIIRFSVETGKSKPQDGTVNRQGARCIACGTSVPFDYIRSEGKAVRMNSQLMAIVAEGQGGRVYLAPDEEHVAIAVQAKPIGVPETDLPEQALGFRVQLYGMTKHRDLFTPRQLVALTTFSDLVSEAREHVLSLTPLPPSPSLMERGERQAMHEPGGSLVSLPAQDGGTEQAATSSSPSPSKMERGLGGEARRALCRELRQRQTPPEEFFWELVRDRRFEGYKFRRQHPLSRFIADFYCPELRLAVELDGGIHAMQVERDRARDEILAQHDIRVVRIHNERFLADPEATLAQLSDLIAHWTTQDEVVSAPTPTHADAQAYADAVATYLGMGVSRLSDICNSLCRWENTKTQVRNLFTRQAISMLWDFAEPNVFADAAGDFGVSIGNLVKALETTPAKGRSVVKQQDATANSNSLMHFLISTDPPYYDNIGYADLSDFFYVWLRRSLLKIYPQIFNTMLVPKAQELIAAPYRFNGDRSKAQQFFEDGLEQAFAQMRKAQNPAYPLTIYYAFKQAESDADEDDGAEESSNGDVTKATASTGWETMLEGLINAGFTVIGTWPIRTELANRTRGISSNALASSIVLVCRPRPVDAPVASRRQFLNALRAELPAALKNLQRGSIAPVDLAQASIGPGMAIYSRYSKVVESDGTPLRVRTALQLINRALDEALAEQEGEYDAETRWAIAWFEQYAMNAGEYGVAETLSKAKNTTVQSLVDAGLLEARAGKVHLLKREELPEAWNPKASRLTVWEVMQRMIHELLDGKGDSGAGDILRKASAQAEVARDLAYRLYTVCERKGWAQEALAYNSLVTSWSEISRLAHREAADGSLWAATFLG